MRNINTEKNIKHFKAMKSNWSEKVFVKYSRNFHCIMASPLQDEDQ